MLRCTYWLDYKKATKISPILQIVRIRLDINKTMAHEFFPLVYK